MAMVQQQQRKRVHLSESAWRGAVKRLGTFTVGEIAADIGCSKATAKKKCDEMAELDPPIVKLIGAWKRDPMFEYIKPQEAGDRFINQQAMRHTETPEVLAAAAAPDRFMEVAQVKYRRASNSVEVRKVVAEACACGWEFHPPNGSSKAKLTKGGRMVKIPNTPRNGGDSADALRRSLFGAPARFRQREQQ